MCVCVCAFALLTNQSVGSPGKEISPDLKPQVSPGSASRHLLACVPGLVQAVLSGAGVRDGVTEGFVNGAALRVEAEPC